MSSKEKPIDLRKLIGKEVRGGRVVDITYKDGKTIVIVKQVIHIPLEEIVNELR